MFGHFLLVTDMDVHSRSWTSQILEHGPSHDLKEATPALRKVARPKKAASYPRTFMFVTLTVATSAVAETKYMLKSVFLFKSFFGVPSVHVLKNQHFSAKFPFLPLLKPVHPGLDTHSALHCAIVGFPVTMRGPMAPPLHLKS